MCPLESGVKMARLPGKIIGEHGVVLCQAIILNQRTHLLPPEFHRRSGAQGLVHLQPELLAPVKKIEQVLGLERLVINENAHRIQAHPLDPLQIPLDDFRVIRPKPNPVFKIVARQADPCRRHVIDAMRLPGFALQQKAAIGRDDEIRVRFGFPDVQFMGKSVDNPALLQEFNRHPATVLGPDLRFPDFLNRPACARLQMVYPCGGKQGSTPAG